MQWINHFSHTDYCSRGVGIAKSKDSEESECEDLFIRDFNLVKEVEITKAEPESEESLFTQREM